MPQPRSIDEHMAAIAGMLRAPRVVNRRVDASTGLAVAEDIFARYDFPRFDLATVDGYAVSGTEAAERYVGQQIDSGADTDAMYLTGIGEEAVPIMSGAKIPHGTRAIIPADEFQPIGTRISLPAVEAEHGIRRKGTDIRTGDLLIPQGTRLGPAAVALLANQGIHETLLQVPPRIILCTGGTEVGAKGVAGIPDANAPMMLAAATDAGIDVVEHLQLPDNPLRVRELLEERVRFQLPDAIVTSGGISHAERDVLRHALADGWFGPVNQTPGRRQGLAMVDDVPVICLPGETVAAMVSFRLYASALLGVTSPPVTAELTEQVTTLPEHDQVLMAVLSTDGPRLLVRPTDILLSANALIHIPAASSQPTAAAPTAEPADALPAGAPVTVYPL